MRGEQEQQARCCKKAFFMAVSLKAGEHFHALFSSGDQNVTLEAGLGCKVATELSKIRWLRLGQVDLHGRLLPQLLRIRRDRLSLFQLQEILHEHRLYLGKVALELRFVRVVISARLLLGDDLHLCDDVALEERLRRGSESRRFLSEQYIVDAQIDVALAQRIDLLLDLKDQRIND